MNYISKITLPNTASYQVKDINNYRYCICETAAATAEKSVTLDSFELLSNVTIRVLFINENSAANPTLKIGDLAAKPIYLNNGNISPWDAGEVVSLTYDGTYWRLNDYGKVQVIRL